MGRIKEAREVKGNYGETAGITCPSCGIRQYPIGQSGEIRECPDCGSKYRLPGGYYKYALAYPVNK